MQKYHARTDSRKRKKEVNESEHEQYIYTWFRYIYEGYVHSLESLFSKKEGIIK